MDVKDNSIQQEQIHYKEKSKEIANKAREKYLEQVSDFKERVKYMSGEATEKAKEVIDTVGTYVKENPQKASVIAIVLGVFIGFVLSLFFRRSKD